MLTIFLKKHKEVILEVLQLIVSLALFFLLVSVIETQKQNSVYYIVANALIVFFIAVGVFRGYREKRRKTCLKEFSRNIFIQTEKS